MSVQTNNAVQRIDDLTVTVHKTTNLYVDHHSTQPNIWQDTNNLVLNVVNWVLLVSTDFIKYVIRRLSITILPYITLFYLFWQTNRTFYSISKTTQKIINKLQHNFMWKQCSCWLLKQYKNLQTQPRNSSLQRAWEQSGKLGTALERIFCPPLPTLRWSGKPHKASIKSFFKECGMHKL